MVEMTGQGRFAVAALRTLGTGCVR